MLRSIIPGLAGSRFRALALALSVVPSFLAAGDVHAALTFDPNGNGTDGGSASTWGQTATAFWWNGTSHGQNYINATPGSDVIFGWGSGSAGSVRAAAALNVKSLTFKPISGTYTLDDSGAQTITLNGNLTLNSGAGAVTLATHFKPMLMGSDRRNACC